MISIILHIILGYFSIGFLVYLFRFAYTSYIDDLFSYLENDLSDLKQRHISKKLGKSGVYVLIYLFDVYFHLTKWPIVLWREIKIQYQKWKVKRLREGISKINTGLEKISEGDSEIGYKLLREGERIVEIYGEENKENL